MDLFSLGEPFIPQWNGLNKGSYAKFLIPSGFLIFSVDHYAEVFIFSTESLLGSVSHASSAESVSFKDFPSGMHSTQASRLLPIRVISMTCSYLHIPRMSRICFSSEVARVFPKQIIGMF